MIHSEVARAGGSAELRRWAPRMSAAARLIFVCGKMAAGKSTLARDLAEQEDAILLVQDEFLERLYPGEIIDIPGFVTCSTRLKTALAPHVCSLLTKGISVV